jgi:hypothetical protein
MPKAADKTEKGQLKAFRKAARDLGCDSDEGQFQDALRTIAKAKPQPQSVPKGKPRNHGSTR